METTVEVKGNRYSVGKMPALDQFHVSRRLAPILAAMGITISMLKGSGDGPPKLDDFAPVLGPVTEMMARMSNSDADYIIFTCLKVVKRDQGGGKFAPITSGASMMFEDIDMLVMLRLVVEVLKESLWDFLPELSAEPPTQSS